MESRSHRPQDYLEACWRILLRSLRMISLSSVVAMVELYRYWGPTYDSYCTNHAPASYLSQSRPRNSWDSNQEQLSLNVFGHATRNSYYINYDEGEFENWDWLSDDVQETATIHDSVVDANTSRDENIYKYLETRRSREKDDVESSICVVCQDELYKNENDDDEMIATLNCGHEYHTHCIKCWLRWKNVCPLCNVVVLPQHRY